MILIRDAKPDDAPVIAQVYGHYVETTTFTFEEVVPSAKEMAARMDKIIVAGLPYLAAEKDGVLIGYAYASPFHNRSAYRFTVENSVYVASDEAGQGVGTALMRRLIETCASRGFAQMIARIGDKQNIASVRLHKGLGFRPVGELPAVGLKFGRWVDLVIMQLALGPGGDPG
ncbi:MAG TPA: GNAT family N-acetyltransferase [Rhizomicrobium sp.]|jgi:L-amino acid N-acyltransferase YncA|nr:GNAT family N-acetyltransferase [Rhizomicrobium sp.]